MSSADGSRWAGTAHQNGGNFGDGRQCPPCGDAVVGLLLLMVFAVFRLPPWLPVFVHESNGVDPSWQMLLNEAVLQGWTFGRDLFFTYGPFGFIHARMYHPETWTMLVAVWIGISVIMADLIWRVSSHGRLSSVGRTLFGIAILEFMSRDAMAVCFSLHALVFYEAAECSRKDAKTRRIAESLCSSASLRLCAESAAAAFQSARLALPILLLAALPWAKFSYFVTGAFLGCALFAAGLLQKRIPWRAILLFVACPLAWLMSGATLAECGQFIGMGFQLAGGYSAAMGLGPESTVGLVVVAASGIVVLTLPVWLAARLRFDDWRLSVLTMLFFHGLLFITWKSCFVRYHAERIPVFLGTVLPLLAYGWLVSRHKESLLCATGSASVSGSVLVRWQHWRSQWHSVVLLGVSILVLAGTVERAEPLNLGSIAAQVTSPLRDQLLAVAESVRDSDWRRDTHEFQLAKIREANPIPELEGSADVFPSKLIVGFAHGLEMRPRPILQGYAAFGTELIERDAEYFRRAAAPDHVLISVGEIDGRLPTMEDSRAWFELLSRYELTDSSSAFLRLSRRPQPSLLLDDEPVIRKTVKWNEAVEVSDDLAGPVWCRIQIKPSLPGRVASILYRLPEIHLKTQVSDDPGDDRTFRLLPGAAEVGFLISPRVETRDDLVQLLRWSATSIPDDVHSLHSENRVSSFSCSVARESGGDLLFEPDITVEFFGISRGDGRSDGSAPRTDVATLRH